MNAPFRRGACPGLSAPMQTGDGLLLRFLPIGTVRLPAFIGLCAAARTFGNGIVEVTARGSIQVRGLTATSAPRFAEAVGTLGISAEDGLPIHVNPLTGLDTDEILDAGKLAADLRGALARSNLAARLSPKVSVTIDGGSVLDVDQLSADVRLRAESTNGAALFRISVGGDATSATAIGFVAPANGVSAALELLEAISQRGSDARARNIIAAEGSARFSEAIADLLLGVGPSFRATIATDREPIGTHRLRDGTVAFGLGLAFGHADAISLEHLAEIAAAMGASGIRAAPGRVLIVIGLAKDALSAFAAEATRLGFIVRADDPRRHVFACAGAPVCASAHMATRLLAPRVVADSADCLGKSFTVHLSGCPKGCAHPLSAALTVVGTPAGGALVANGTVRDSAYAVVASNQLLAAIAGAVRESRHERRHV